MMFVDCMIAVFFVTALQHSLKTVNIMFLFLFASQAGIETAKFLLFIVLWSSYKKAISSVPQGLYKRKAFIGRHL